MVTPIAFAVRRLNMNCGFVILATGKGPGSAPLKILSAKGANFRQCIGDAGPTSDYAGGVRLVSGKYRGTGYGIFGAGLIMIGTIQLIIYIFG
jgi:hypothetical protein